MKVYVDELPKKCADCPFYKLDTYVDVYGYQTNSHECVLDGSMLTNSCPLQSLADYTKQVRKEVETLKNLVCNTRDILSTILIATDRPVKNTSKKDCYQVLSQLQNLYKSHMGRTNKWFLDQLQGE